MTDFLKQYGQWGLVAGAAEGIGAAFCRELASRGMNIVMVDINRNEMDSLAGQIRDEFRVDTLMLGKDLSEPSSVNECLAAVNGLDCRLLVFNAAFSRVKPFLAAQPEELEMYIDTNTRAPLKLAYSFARKLSEAKSPGGILLMSSLAGIWGTRLVAVYSATKAFNLLLAEALFHELRDRNIDVSACCAGATATPGYMGTNPAANFFGPPLMDPGKVASIAIKNLGRKPVIIPGTMNRINYFLLTRILPRKISVSLVNRMMAKTYEHLI